MTSRVLRADTLLTFDAPRTARGHDLVGAIADAAVWLEGEGPRAKVRWCGRAAELPADAPAPSGAHALLMPAWVECHTHALFGGSRHADFALRNAGTSYAEILEAGGGIMSTVDGTRATSDDVLVDTLVERLDDFWRQGVAVVEVKTGYGLSVQEELRHLRLIREAARQSPVHVVSTCLSAHAIPREFRDDRAAYVGAIVEEILPAVAAEGLAEQVDVFCDRGAYTVDESRRVLEAARSLGFGLRLHAEELAHTGATRLACELGALSADHLEWIDADDVAAMAEADVAAVLLPIVTTFLDLEHRAPARALADAGVRVAVSTDYNPGSAHSTNLALAASLSCTLHKLTPAEALAGVTRVAAEVCGLAGRYGVVKPGAFGGLLASDLKDWRALPYFVDAPPMRWA